MVSLKNLLESTCTTRMLIQFLIDKKLLPRLRKCICGRLMNISKGGKLSEGYRYRCSRPCRKEISLRKGTFFEESKLPLREILIFIYVWAYDECSYKKAHREINISIEPFVAWRKYLRSICCEILTRNSGVIGGEGHTVQIDESLFTKRKNNTGRVLPQQWVFGGIDSDTGDCFMEIVPNRSRETLMEVILRRILPGTRIVSDCWAAYNEISRYGYQHETVNHVYNFVNPETGYHTQKVENLWFLAKMRNKREGGTSRGELGSYLNEFIWRRKYRNYDAFDLILEHISEIYQFDPIEY